MRVRVCALTVALVLAALASAILLTSETAQSAGPATACVEDIPGSVICETAAATIAPCANDTAVPRPRRNPGLVADCTALLAAKDTLRGTATLNWDATRAITTWDGVTTGGTPARVRRLELASRNLTGRLPAQLGSLAELRVLRLDDNQLRGAIPAALGALTKLNDLRLHDNRLTGSIPAALGSLTKLTVLRLHDNRLTGSIPAALATLNALEVLRLHDNRLSGTIPVLATLTKLTALRLDGNRLTGSIPVLAALTQLEILRLDGNRLTGAIPALGALTQLEILWLDGNRLTGAVPALGTLTNLTELRLHGNQLTGAIPAALGSLTKLKILRLNGNRLAGTIPAELGSLRALGSLYLGGNAGLTGCLPKALRTVRHNDLASLKLADCAAAPLALSYNRLDTTGKVAAPGSYAFLSAAPGQPAGASAATVVTTYEGLRDGTAKGLRLHQTDAGGTSRASLYNAVAVGDIVEWRKAADCFVRYAVTAAPAPATGATARDFGVKWMTYAFTGCIGVIDTTGSRTITWSPTNLQSADMTIPIRHGNVQLIPFGWTGTQEDQVLIKRTRPSIAETSDLATIRQLSIWREPDLPDGWQLRWAWAGYDGLDGFEARYSNGVGGILDVMIYYAGVIGGTTFSTTADHQRVIVETRIIDGHPAIVEYSPSDDRGTSTWVFIPNEATGISYIVRGSDPVLYGGANIEATIEVARSLYRTAP